MGVCRAHGDNDRGLDLGILKSDFSVRLCASCFLAILVFALQMDTTRHREKGVLQSCLGISRVLLRELCT